MKSLYSGNLPKDLDAVAVVMAGGAGTRFWPMSRRSLPKQFLSLGSDGSSLIQDTAKRLEPLTSAEGVMVVTARDYIELVREHLPRAAILAEPMARNTAPCIGYAAQKILSEIGDVPMLCLPSDHLIVGQAGILDVYRRAINLAANEDVLVTIGITPAGPETGYGYIRRGAPDESGLGRESRAFAVQSFVEKPDHDTACRYVESGEYFWNSGMFIWRPSVILSVIKKLIPDLAISLEKIESAFGADSEAEQITDEFEDVTPISIDFGVMEKADNVRMIVGDSFTWSDVGSWDAWVDTKIEQSGQADRNVTLGNVELIDCHSTAVVGGKKFVAGIGVSDLIIVETDDALLVCHRDRAQEVKKIVDLLSDSGKTELL